MFCSGCGSALAPGQPACPQCGRPAVLPVPLLPGFEYQLESYRGRLRLLSIFWFVYGGLTLVMGFAGLAFAQAFFMGGFGPWMNGPMHGWPPGWMPMAMHFAWVMVAGRAVLAFVAGWGLMEHAEWGRIAAIVVAILSLIHIPFGTALGIWTLVMLLGYRNSSLYEQL
ncbi:MAG: hypothetical protein ACLGSH_12795 [Acidobacteriota bacterium]